MAMRNMKDTLQTMPGAIPCWTGFWIGLSHCPQLPTAGSLARFTPSERENSKMSLLLTDTMSTRLKLPPKLVELGILSA